MILFDLDTIIPQRMFMIVPYNIKPIQMGIQAGHAKESYEIGWSDTPQYQRWLQRDRAVIIKNGGTTNYRRREDGRFVGSLNNLVTELEEIGVRHATFDEEDLNDALTGIALLADERIWDLEKYPHYRLDQPYGDRDAITYDEWVELIGGYEQVALRTLLWRLPLAA